MSKPPLSVCVWTKTKLPREDTIACLHLLSLCLRCRWSLTSSNYVDVLRCLQLLQSIQMRNQQVFILSAQDCCSPRGIMQEETERNSLHSFFVCVQEEQSRTMPVCAVTTSSNLEPFVALFLCSFCNTEDFCSFAWVVPRPNNSASFFVAHASDQGHLLLFLCLHNLYLTRKGTLRLNSLSCKGVLVRAGSSA